MTLQTSYDHFPNMHSQIEWTSNVQPLYGQFERKPIMGRGEVTGLGVRPGNAFTENPTRKPSTTHLLRLDLPSYGALIICRRSISEQL